jgi:rhomboid protease GluP
MVRFQRTKIIPVHSLFIYYVLHLPKLILQRKKFTLIFLPFLRISLPAILLCALFCQLVDQRQAVEINEEILQFGVPFMLPFIRVLIWLRPCFKLLKMKRTGRSDPDPGLSFLAAISIFVPMMLSAKYMEGATCKL